MAGLRKGLSVFMAILMLTGIFMVLPTGTQNAMGYMTPGMGMTLTFEDLVLMSGGAVTGGFPFYQVHETITVMPSDILTISGGLNIMMDPGMNIAIEILGNLDGMMGMGTLFHSMGPGTWRGIWVHDSGMLNANGFIIWDAQNGIYIDHTMGFGMVQIMDCTISGSSFTGITMLGTMGGPMIFNNIISNCGDAGIFLRDTSAQCMNNEISFCAIGIHAEGMAAPSMNQNNIHDNWMIGISLSDFSGGMVVNNVLWNNEMWGISMYDSFADISDNRIWGWNATLGTLMHGAGGIFMAAVDSSDWQTTIRGNWITGGNGDEGYDGGHAIEVGNYQGNNPTGPQIDIFDNYLIKGGNGGITAAVTGWVGGDGGHGIYFGNLPDMGDWLSDNHAVRITENVLIAGGNGGEDSSGMISQSGNGGHGICVRDDNNAGSLLSTGNLLVVGGGGGGRMSPGLCGDGGHGLCIEDCDSGVRVDIRNHPDVVGGMGGAGPTGMGQGGASMRFLRCDSFHVLNVSGRSAWTFGDIEDCDGDFDLRDIRISDSDANGGNLVRATGSSSTGNNENWAFGGKNGVSGVVAKDCGRLKLRVANATTSNATGFRFDNCSDLSLDRITATVRDGTGMEILACTNVTLTNATLNGSRESPVPEKSVIQVIGGDRVGIGPVAVAYGNNRFAVTNRNAHSVTLIDATNVNFINSIVVSENCGGIAFGNDRFAVVNNCRLTVTNGTGLAINECLNLDLVSLNLSGTGSADPMTPCDGIEAYRWETGNATWLNGTGFRDSGLNLTECSNITVKDFEWTWGDWSECKKPCIGGNKTRFALVRTANITSVNRTAIDLENCTQFNITKSTFKTVNATGLKAANVDGLVVMDSFFDVTYNISEMNNTGMDLTNITDAKVQNTTAKVKNGSGARITNSSAAKLTGIRVGPNGPGNGGGVEVRKWCNYIRIENSNISSESRTGIGIDNSTGVSVTNTIVTTANGTGISASNLTVLWVNYSKVNVPHPTYNGPGVRFKAVARGGCAHTIVNVTSGVPYFRWAIDLNQTSNFTVKNCTVKGLGGGGVRLNESRDNVVLGNTIQEKDEGVRLYGSDYNSLFHNNFLGNLIQASDDTGLNSWDNGYPSGGNYWSDYVGPDVMQGPLQNVPGADWIGDIPYSAIAGGTGTQDTYPLAKPTIEGRVQHLPFRINSNEDFDWEHGVVNWATGDGSEVNPWVIENWDVNGTGYGYSIYVGNTTEYFTVRDCALYSANGGTTAYFWNTGLTFFGVRNGLAIGNACNRNLYYGILLNSSANISLQRNECNRNWHGIYLDTNNEFNEIHENTASDNIYFGLAFSYSNNNEVFYNMASSNGQAGIQLKYSEWNALSDNTVSLNGKNGIYLYIGSNNNTILRNIVDTNSQDGLFCLLSKNNTISENRILNNVNTGIRVLSCSDHRIYHNAILTNTVQANDTLGSNIWHNGYPSGGNYWSDYVGPDLMSGPLQNIPGPDGIGDVPYLNIQGGTGAVDQYPLMAPWTPEPASFFNISLGVGWNLISIPLDLEDTTISNVLASISGKYDSVKAYDALDPMDPWKSYRQNGTANDLPAVDRTVGVWLHATEACTLSVSGYIPASTAVMLRAGWNLIGYPTLTPRAAWDALLGTGFDMLECFDPASPYIRTMDPLELMMPGQGYWIHVPADTVWTVDW